jgi:hypothetical protein
VDKVAIGMCFPSTSVSPASHSSDSSTLIIIIIIMPDKAGKIVVDVQSGLSPTPRN